MPYIIETTTPDPANAKDYGRVGDATPGAPSLMGAVRGCWPPKVSRTAVATLDEVNAAVRAECERAGGGPRTAWTDPAIYNRSLHDGGTIGPLPDGTVIAVRWAEWIDIGIDPFDSEVDAEVDRLGGYSKERCNAALAAFNA